FLHDYRPPPDPHSFPTRRSSDLGGAGSAAERVSGLEHLDGVAACARRTTAESPFCPEPTTTARGDISVLLALLGRSERAVETPRSEEHTSELQSRGHLVCRLLLE